MTYKEVFKIAARMLELSDVNEIELGLQMKLMEVENLCRKADGGLISKQVIAMIISNYFEKKER